MSGAPDGPPLERAALGARARRLQQLARARRALVIVVGLVVLVLDQITKVAVRAGLERGEQIPILPGLALSHTRNEGLAFGLFPGRADLVAAATAVVLVVIVIVVLRAARQNLAVAIGGGALIGGSVGNLIDRALRGGVTDFIDPTWWPAFNLADIGIVCGSAAIVLSLALGDERPEEP